MNENVVHCLKVIGKSEGKRVDAFCIGNKEGKQTMSHWTFEGEEEGEDKSQMKEDHKHRESSREKG